MITKQERIKLRSLAQNVKATVWVGKDQFSESVLKQINEELFNHELVKISLQDSAKSLSDYDLASLGTQLGAEIVTTIGKKVILFKHSEKKGIRHILTEKTNK